MDKEATERRIKTWLKTKKPSYRLSYCAVKPDGSASCTFVNKKTDTLLECIVSATELRD